MTTLRQWGEEIAACLPGWTHTPPKDGDTGYKYSSTVLTHTTGVEFYVTADAWNVKMDMDVPEDSRIKFSGRWPGMLHIGDFSPNQYTDKFNYHATCAASRSAESIVKGIKTRFLEPYMIKWHEMKQRLEQTVQKRKRTFAFVQELAEILDYPPLKDGDWVLDRHSIGGFDIYNPESVGLKLHSLSPEMTKNIAMVLAGKAVITPRLFNPDEF